MTFVAKSSDVTHTLAWKGQPAASNIIEKREARRIIKVWTAWGIVG